MTIVAVSNQIAHALHTSFHWTLAIDNLVTLSPAVHFQIGCYQYNEIMGLISPKGDVFHDSIGSVFDEPDPSTYYECQSSLSEGGNIPVSNIQASAHSLATLS
jgi:hypothetical protein